MNCPICLCPLAGDPLTDDDVANLKPLRCGHFCHADCCEEWFITSKTTQCPICRRAHQAITHVSYQLASLIIVDLVRLALIFYMAYAYYQTKTLEKLYIYIIVDCLSILQCWRTSKGVIDGNVFVKYMTIEALQSLVMRMEGSYFLTLPATLLFSYFLQLRIHIPTTEFFLSFCCVALSVYTVSCCLYYSIDK